MKNKAKYYKNVNDVIIISPTIRFFSNIFGKTLFVVKCKTCKKIPTEIYGEYCLDCVPKN